MIVFSDCKINLGLNIIARRADGYHDLESLFLPVRNLCDIVELHRRPEGETTLISSGFEIDCPPEKNLCIKAFELMKERFSLEGGVRINLHKNIPLGAGLGGGSSNAVTVLKMVDKIWELRLGAGQLESLAAELGSDTVFFVRDIPAIAASRGEILTPFDIDLSGYYILIIKPDISISTAKAYDMITPGRWEVPLVEVIKKPVEEWRGLLNNDFEGPLFEKYPVLGTIKQLLYDFGAVYASMSGSGSALYGIFPSLPLINKKNFTMFENAFTHVWKVWKGSVLKHI